MGYLIKRDKTSKANHHTFKYMKPHFLEILDPSLNGKRVISVISDTVFNDTTLKGKGGSYLGGTGKQQPNFEGNRGKEIIYRNRGFRFFVNKGTSQFISEVLDN